MEAEEVFGNEKENSLAVNGTMAVLEFAYAIYLTSWVAGFFGIYFLYQAYKTMKIPGEINLKSMIVPSVMVSVIFVSIISLLSFVLGSFDG